MLNVLLCVLLALVLTWLGTVFYRLNLISRRQDKIKRIGEKLKYTTKSLEAMQVQAKKLGLSIDT